MNKVCLLGRLTRDPETKYTQNQLAITKYGLAVNRIKKGEADFINIIAFGKAGDFAQKYFRKGMQVALTGRIQTGSYTDRNGVKKYTFDIIADEQYFADAKRDFEPTNEAIPEEFEEGMPF